MIIKWFIVDVLYHFILWKHPRIIVICQMCIQSYWAFFKCYWTLTVKSCQTIVADTSSFGHDLPSMISESNEWTSPNWPLLELESHLINPCWTPGWPMPPLAPPYLVRTLPILSQRPAGEFQQYLQPHLETRLLKHQTDSRWFGVVSFHRYPGDTLGLNDFRVVVLAIRTRHQHQNSPLSTL